MNRVDTPVFFSISRTYFISVWSFLCVEELSEPAFILRGVAKQHNLSVTRHVGSRMLTQICFIFIATRSELYLLK